MKERSYCQFCGAQTSEGRYCAVCGTRLRKHTRNQLERVEKTPKSETNDTVVQGFGQFIGFISVLILLIGLLFPWATATALGTDLATFQGLDFRMGLVVGAVGLVIAIIILIPHSGLHIVSASLSMLVAFAILMFVSEPLLLENATELERDIGKATLDIGYGAYVSLLGAVGAIFGSLLSFIS